MSLPTVPSIAGRPDRSRAEDQCPGAGPGELTARQAAAWAAAPARWRHLVRHVPGERWYLPLGATPGASAWLITWAPGTGLALHDHGGVSGTMAVVGGQLTERYGTTADLDGARRRPGELVPLPSRRLGRGSLTTFAPDHVHEVRNDGTEPAVSIHVYAPILEEMAFYDGPAPARPGVRTHTQVIGAGDPAPTGRPA
jgi:hypothetical protein